ncbi:MAG TPA: metallophosphoesterase family protein [Vineibacter sp.]|nr:metallophosphoesterase family protein [Vineibacter sp.]
MPYRNRVTGHRFGLLADTHDNAVDWPKALDQIRAALGDVDAIVHCGDLCTGQALATLVDIAPVWAVRTSADVAASPPVLVDGPRVLEAGRVLIGVVSTLNAVGAEVNPTVRFVRTAGRGVADSLFGRPVDVCVFGGTHRAEIIATGGTLFVNPGSPTLAERRSVGILVVDDQSARVEIRSIG